MKSRQIGVFFPDKHRSKRARAAAAYLIPPSRILAERLTILSFIAALALLVFVRTGLCQDAPAAASRPASVTVSTLEAKIAGAEAATDLRDEAKTKLVELYRKTLSNLQATTSSREAAQAFQQASQTAPAETQALRKKMEEPPSTAPEDTLEANRVTPLRELESLLQKEKANHAAVDALGSDFARRLDAEAQRPTLIRQRLTEGSEQQEEVAAQLKLPPPASESPAQAVAWRWELETRYEALSAEIKMLDQELLSQPARVDLMKAKRDKAEASVEWVGKRVKLLENLVTERRQAEAEEAKTVAEVIRREAEGRHSLVVRLADQNAALTEEIVGLASELADLAAQTEETDKLTRQLEEDFKSAQETVTIGIYGLNEELGYLLLLQRQSLPDVRSFRRQAREWDDKAGKVGVQRLLHRRERRQLSDPAAYVVGIVKETAAEETPAMRERLADLATRRKALLEKAIESDDFYLHKLGELKSAQQRLLAMIERFDEFLDVHLLWVRSASPTELNEAGALPEQVSRILSPGGWYDSARALLYQTTHSPVFVLLAVALGALLWIRRHLIKFIEATSSKLGNPTADHFVYSLQALAVTLIAAAAWPLVMSVAGWQLRVSAEATDFSNGVGGALLTLAVQFFLLRAARLICIPQGLAAAHFGWPESSLRLLRRELERLTWIYLPAAGVHLVAVHLDPLNAGWAIGRVTFVILVLSLSLAVYRLLHPKTGVLAAYMQREKRQRFRRLHRLWYPFLVLAPLALGALAVLGYLYAATTLLEHLVDTAWMVIGLILLAALAQRWLGVTRRRIAYETAMERREEEARQEPDRTDTNEGGGLLDFEEAELDLEALSDTSSHLISTAVVVSGVIGLWMIWSDVLPALRIFEDVILWNQTVTEGGEDKIDPVTLADIGLVLVYGAVTFLLARQLPAILEIILLHQFHMSAGSRYTFTTLTSYTVFTIGILLVLNTIGAEWSQLQWLVAALSVGIGFGLQEIVANFISGLIILFERPIRVGDMVTVGETDGLVTKIRIRATTIRSLDRKELLVPNKEFITGRLLNWTLSDPVIRLIVVVGVAYGTDVDEAHALMLEAAEENEQVLDDPNSIVTFECFGDHSLTLQLRVFIDDLSYRVKTITALHKAITRKFEESGIVIAFPQRDLHLDTDRPLQVELRREREDRRDGDAETLGGK